MQTVFDEYARSTTVSLKSGSQIPDRVTLESYHNCSWTYSRRAYSWRAPKFKHATVWGELPPSTRRAPSDCFCVCAVSAIWSESFSPLAQHLATTHPSEPVSTCDPALKPGIIVLDRQSTRALRVSCKANMMWLFWRQQPSAHVVKCSAVLCKSYGVVTRLLVKTGTATESLQQGFRTGHLGSIQPMNSLCLCCNLLFF